MSASTTVSAHRRKVLLTSLSGQLGGMEIRLRDEASFLASEGGEVSIAMSSFPGRDEWLSTFTSRIRNAQIYDFDPEPFFEEWRLQRIRYLLERHRSVPKLRAERFNLAHVFYAWTLDGGSRLTLCAAARIPCVLSIHNCFPRTKLDKWRASLMANAFEHVCGVYAVSRDALDRFIDIYGKWLRERTRVDVIHNAVDLDRFFPSTDRRLLVREELSIPPNAPVIGSIARLDKQKNPQAVLNVFDSVLKAIPDAYLVLCGDGPLREAVASDVSSRGLASRVRLLGFRGDTERIFPALDVHLLLSSREGFGITSIESLACGVPVVATDIPGTREVLRGIEHARLVSLDDVKSAAHAVIAFLTRDPSTHVRAAAARAEMKSRYARSLWSERLRDFYEQASEVARLNAIRKRTSVLRASPVAGFRE